MQLLDCHPGQTLRFRFADCPAVDRAQEKIQQALPRGGVVEHVADERGLRRFLDEIFEPRGRGIEPFKKERKHGRVTSRKLSRMQVPALVVRGYERMLDVSVVKPPGAMNGFA